MAVVTEVGTVTFTTSASATETVTLTNFGASNPLKAVLFFATFEGTTTGGANRGTTTVYGMADGTDEGCIHTIAPDNLGTSNTSRSHIARAIAFYDASKTLIGEATITDWQDDSFELTYSNVTGGGWKVQYIAIGGAAMTDAKVVHWKEPEDDESSTHFVSVGFQPDAIIDFASGLLSGTIVDGTVKQADDARASIGFTVGSDKYCHAFEDSDNAATMSQKLYTGNKSSKSRLLGSANEVELAPTTNGFNATVTSEANTTTTSYVHTSLCLKGGGYHLSEVTSPTSTGTQDFTYTGEVVKGALAFGSGLAKGSSSAQNRCCIAAYDTADNWVVGWNNVDNVTTSDNYSWWFDNTFIRTYFDSSGTIGMDATVSVVSDETLRLTWTDVEATGRSFGILAFTELPVEEEDADDTIGFTDLVEHNYFFEDVENTFVYDSEASLLEFIVLAADRLFFYGAFVGGQEVEHNYFALVVSNEYDFVSESGYNQELSITEYLGFTDRYFADPLSNFLGLVDTANRAYIESALNGFDWNSHEDDPAEALVRAYNSVNEFVYTETVTASNFEELYDYLNFEDGTDSSDSEYDRPATHEVIKQHLSYKITGRSCPDKEYAPFIGSSGDTSYPEVSPTPPTLGSGVFTLTHPRVSPTTTLILKNPVFGNTDNLSFVKVDRRTRGGEHIIYSDLAWSETQTLELNIENICQTETTIDELIEFLNDSLGQEIGLLDWENRQWKGLIVVPETDILPTVSGHKIRIVFEGTLV